VPSDLLMVSLSGGTFDGQLAKAPRPPGALRLDAKAGNEEWSELYVYDGNVVEHPVYGTVPIMTYWKRKDLDRT
jgi:hypothetical protein